MMHIDRYRTPDYFQKYISKQEVRIDKFKKILVGCAESEKTRVYRILSDRYKDLISAQFSNNEKLTKIKSSFVEYANFISEVGFSCYSECVDFLSLQIILDIKDVSISVPEEYDDDLTQILISYINDSEYRSRGHLYETLYYSIFLDYYKGNRTFNELMDYVSHNWYKLSMGFYWYDSHSKDYDVYAGYWCYIASAVIRIKGDYYKVNDRDLYIV